MDNSMEDDLIMELSYPEPEELCVEAPSRASQRGKGTLSVLGAITLHHQQHHYQAATTYKPDPHQHPMHGSIEVEALLSLNDTIISRNESARPKSSAGDSSIPITAPLPLSYAVRGKGAYSSILSIGNTDDDSDEPQDDTTTTPVIDLYSYTPRGILRGDVLFSGIPKPVITTSTTGNYSPNGVKENIDSPAFYCAQNKEYATDVRPITPSTLMVLTEPCLMAWCYKLELMDNDELSPTTASTSPVPTPFQLGSYYIIEPDIIRQNPVGMDDSDMIPKHIQYEFAKPQNDWGY